MELEEELLELARALKAHAEWQQASGASGLPEGNFSSSPAIETDPTASQPAAGIEAPEVRAGVVERPRDPQPREPLTRTAEPTSAIADVQHRLDVLTEEARACTACGLHAGRKQAVFARGTGTSRLCFVGEGPGADEDEQGFPFVGKAGQLLDRMISAMGLERDEVYVCNIIKCRPPNNRKPQPEEIAACVHFVEKQIELLAPEVIVALGATAVEGLFGTSQGITRMRGRFKLYKGRIAVMPTFHPAYLLRNPAAKRDVWEDLQAVLRQLGRPVPPPKKGPGAAKQ